MNAERETTLPRQRIAGQALHWFGWAALAALTAWLGYGFVRVARSGSERFVINSQQPFEEAVVK